MRAGRSKGAPSRCGGARRARLCALALLLGACGSDDPEASVEQIVAEAGQRIEAVMRAERERGGALPRFNQSKTVACLAGELRVHDDVPEHLRAGVFAEPRTYPVVARFANASERDDAEKDIRGLSLRLSEVDGEPLWGERGHQDFLFNSHPTLFVDTPETFLDFIEARQRGRELAFFLNPLDPHLKSLWTVFRAREAHASPLDIRYFSTVPFRHGEDGSLAVKHALTPCSAHRTDDPVGDGPNRLRAAIAQHLERGPACFTFGVQTRNDPESMPIDDASVIWREADAPFEPVATITFGRQDFASEAALSECERRAFNPWQALPAHEPLGRMNAVRRELYAKAAALRREETP